MADGVTFTGEAAERIARAVRWLEPRMGSGLTPEPGRLVNEAIYTVRVTGAVSSGLYPAKITGWNPVTSAWDDHQDCKIKPLNSEVLVSGTRYRGTPIAVTTDDPPRPVFLNITGAGGMAKGKLSGSLTPGSSATMDVWAWNGTAEADTGEDLTVYDWLLNTGQSIASGVPVVAEYDSRSGRYYVVGARCS